MKKILLVRPPRYLWPPVNESDNFLMPLGLPCIASALRKDIPGIQIKIIDCPPLKIGWKTLASLIKDEKPDIIGAGEEALYHHEAVKVFQIAKDFNPEVVTIAGGHFFSWMPEHSLERFPIDYIVRFEGEETIVELVKALIEKKSVENVKGISYKCAGKIKNNPLRPLVADLDSLPMPAWDLMPVKNYSPAGYLWPKAATLESGRGCIGHCSFCSLWTFWGEHGSGNNRLKVTQHYRKKSPQRVLEEIDILYHKYGRRFLHIADPTWNVDPKWVEEICDGILKRKFKNLHWWAYLRADYIIRDEKIGLFAKMVKAGLNHPLVGVERLSEKDLKNLDKNYNQSMIKQAFGIMKKYPQVCRQGTLITCLRDDTRESMLELPKYAQELDIDGLVFHPVAPVPGTILYEEAKEKGWLEVKDFKEYDWCTPVWSSQTLSREELAKLNIEVTKRFYLSDPLATIKKLFSRSVHTRRVYRWFVMNLFFVLCVQIKDRLLKGKKEDLVCGYLRLIKPKWYDS